MTFVPEFSHDIFISYTHLDDEPDEQNVEWVSEFHKHLETGLRQRLRSDVSVFFDLSHLRAQDELEHLLKNARQSAVFLPVFSPNYGERPWTLDELRVFGETTQINAAVAAINRIVTIEIFPVEEEVIPAALRNLKRTRFYYEDKTTKVQHKLTARRENKVDGKRITDLYVERMGQLVADLVDLLRELKKRVEAAAHEKIVAPSVQPAPSLLPARRFEGDAAPVSLAAPPRIGKTVLLAEPTGDLYDAAQEVRTYLDQFGINVIPEGDYPVGGTEFSQAVRCDLERSDLFIQLLGKYASKKPSDLRQSDTEAAQSYSLFQYEAAKRLRIPTLQWHAPDVNPELITHHDRQLLGGPDVQVMGLQQFMRTIRERIEQQVAEETAKQRKIEEAARQQVGQGGNDQSFFFINADADDGDLAEMLLKAFEAHHRTAFLPLKAGTAQAIDEDFEENLIHCEGMLLVFGRTPTHWVRGQLRRYAKLAWRREKPPRCKKFVYAPGAKPEEIGATSSFDGPPLDFRDNPSFDRVCQMVGELCRS
jgi:hypothetical protein